MTTSLGTALGSPAFMSPEQARARWEFVDARTDLWALGAVMFSTLSGEFVHGAITASEMIIATATRPARPLQSVWPEAPDVVAAIVDRALAYERADRWQDARSMQAAVRRAMKIDFAKPRQIMPSMLDLTDVDPVPRSAPPIASSRPPPDFAAKIERPSAAPSSASASPPPSSAPPPSSPPPSASVPPAATTTSTPVAVPEPAPPPARSAPEHRSVRSMAVLGLFIALGLSIAGVAIGMLSRRTVVVTVPATPPAPPPTVSAAVTTPTPTPEPAPTATAAAGAEPTAEAAASAAPSATSRSSSRGANKKPPPKTPAKGKYAPPGL
jgi:serine/threonine-protein kinase